MIYLIDPMKATLEVCTFKCLFKCDRNVPLYGVPDPTV